MSNSGQKKIVYAFRRNKALLHCLLVALLFSCGCFLKEVQNKHTVWGGNVFINKKLVLDVDVLIKPGTHIMLGKDGEILFTGTVTASGTQTSPIIFTSIERKPSSWKEVNILHSRHAVFKNCIFEYATWGLHVHFSNTFIKNCIFRSNYGGIRFRSGPVIIKESIFRDNHFGIRLNNSSPLITENTFTNNGTSIFLRDGVRKIYIKNNNFLKPINYHVQMGEEQKHDILMSGNWWSETNYKNIRQLVFDKSNSEYIGKVILTPMLLKPFPVVFKGK